MQVYNNSLILPFYYVVSSGVLAALGTAQVTLTMSADSRFELYSIMGSSSVDLDDDTMPNNFALQITDQATGQQLSSARVPQRNLAGVSSNGWGMLSKYPITFPPSDILIFDFLELSNGSNTVTLVLKGYKIFNVKTS